MKILVCVKQVPDTSQVKIDPKTNRLQRSGVKNILNPFDAHALEAALMLREQYGGMVTVLTMGPPQAASMLRECIAKGADRAVLLTDRRFGGADTLATAYTLAAGIRKQGEFDVVICGKQAVDGDTAQVGSQIAEMLDIPQVTNVSHLEWQENQVLATREHEDGYEVLEVALPLLLTVGKSLNTPRYPSIKGLLQAKEAEIEMWGADDLDIEPERIGIQGSPTRVRRTFTPQLRQHGKIQQVENVEEAVADLWAYLQMGSSSKEA